MLSINPRQVPVPATLLGFGGLLPFAITAVATISLADPAMQDVARRALVAYGAVILSFLGGVRWGVAIAPPVSADVALARPLAFSVLPALLGWSAVLVGPAAGALMLVVCFTLLLLADLRLRAVPDWYRRLRVPLSAGAIASLLAGALA
jgi:Protein of unknown function (DUF3429)